MMPLYFLFVVGIAALGVFYEAGAITPDTIANFLAAYV